MDLNAYPPPDLAIESDVTSNTTLDIYARLQVPEVWVYRQATLTVHLLQNSNYVKSDLIHEILANRPPPPNSGGVRKNHSPQNWGFGGGKIAILTTDFGLLYVKSTQSLIFPHFSIQTLVPELLDRASLQGTSGMLRSFRSGLIQGEFS